jgi:hypothetical protein
VEARLRQTPNDNTGGLNKVRADIDTGITPHQGFKLLVVEILAIKVCTSWPTLYQKTHI